MDSQSSESLVIVKAIERLEVQMGYIHKDLQSHLTRTETTFEKHGNRITDLEHSRTRFRTLILGIWAMLGISIGFWFKSKFGL